MNEQDYKYLLASYQQKTLDVFSQLIVAEAKNRQLSDLNESLNKTIGEQQKEIEKLSAKPKRGKAEGDFE